MRNIDRFIILCIAITVVFLIAAVVEPCDGHSCAEETNYAK